MTFKGKRLVLIYPVSRETIFGVLDHLKLHNYGGAINPYIEIDCWGTAKPRREVPKTKKFCVKMASFPIWIIYRNPNKLLATSEEKF